jgi:PAS domain S-box-containing protein
MKNEILAMLRARAEKVLNEHSISDEQDRALEFNKIFHELQVYQVELEMQNEELISAAQEIQKQKDRFSSLFEAAPIAYIVISKEGMILDINRTGLRLFNKDKNMMVGKPFAAFVSSPDISNFYQFLRNITRTGSEHVSQLQFLSQDKKTIGGLLQGVPVKGEELDQQIYLTLTDITERQKAENALIQAKQRLELALDASDTGICELDPETGRFYLDTRSCHILGLEASCFDGPFEKVMEKVHPEDRKVLEQMLRSAIIRDQRLGLDFRILSNEHEVKYIQVRGRLICEGKEKRRFIATFTDISERKLLEMAARDLKEEQDKVMLEAAIRAEENEKKRMSEVLHHGVAQMLYAAKINLENLKAQARHLPIEKVTELIEQTIRDVRNLSFELTPVVLADFGLKATIEEMASRLKNRHLTIKSKVKIMRHIPVDFQLNIYRITQELVNNCIKHAKCDLITIDINKKNDWIFINVADNGIGFDPDRDARKSGSTGLSSIRNRIKLYDGKMEVKPNVPTGTFVTVMLKHIIEPAIN